MLVSTLVQPLLRYTLVGPSDVDVTSITADSRAVVPGSMFVAIRGFTVDGHAYVNRAVTQGAVAVCVEETIEGLAVPQVVVPNTMLASSVLADVFYRHPSKQLAMIGVTGTNGKTTTTHLIEKILEDAGETIGLMGTIGKRIAGVTVDAANTTPQAVDLQANLAEMVQAGCTYGIMEVSSHALDEGRVSGTQYHIAVFTNLTQDHLDFHGTMENYLAAKGKLFTRLGNTYGDGRHDSAYAVLNADDDASNYLAKHTAAQILTYGIDAPADIQARDVQIFPDGVHFTLVTPCGIYPVQLCLTGKFNVSNALAAFAVGYIEQIPVSQMVKSLESIVGVPGRFESVAAGQPFTVVVDYSHTPDSLEKALLTVEEFAKERIITVVGCGGDRDKTKRPLMAKVAVAHSHLTILTSDNPRTEDPMVILADMEQGVMDFGGCYEKIVDRRLAIEYAISIAQPGDVILLAGKGHETYQIVGKEKHHFDDREIAHQAILGQLQNE